jgi:hypothetical protein
MKPLESKGFLLVIINLMDITKVTENADRYEGVLMKHVWVLLWAKEQRALRALGHSSH